MKKTILFLLSFLFSVLVYGQKEKYSRAKIYLDDKEKTLANLSKLGLAVDHGQNKKNVFFISDFSQREINVAKEHGYTVDILIDDVSAYYSNQNKEQTTKKKSDPK